MIDRRSLYALMSQVNIRELEKEVKLLKNLKHPNIVECDLIMRISIL